ncbi:UNKNOWN [Stylonychia lemnae]|uniref:Uncharacterized protein n=1 Tax=Stylonychia lemnae TaxID=5949 RepID=A0A078B4D6_STYLE|nr:UNKNOWN [Stylonychia lemnae]|eukprot:CDW89344.1 UNKNOWN [Stylonychia lemnae]
MNSKNNRGGTPSQTDRQIPYSHQIINQHLQEKGIIDLVYENRDIFQDSFLVKISAISRQLIEKEVKCNKEAINWQNLSLKTYSNAKYNCSYLVDSTIDEQSIC